jgi:hypothetical protein
VLEWHSEKQGYARHLQVAIDRFDRYRDTGSARADEVVVLFGGYIILQEKSAVIEPYLIINHHG